MGGAIEGARVRRRPRSSREHFVMPLADDLAIDHLLLVPPGNKAAVLEAGHQLIEGRPALAHAGVAQSLAQGAAGGGLALQLGHDQELQVRQSGNRH